MGGVCHVEQMEMEAQRNNGLKENGYTLHLSLAWYFVTIAACLLTSEIIKHIPAAFMEVTECYQSNIN